jgi:hypothetical protein
MSFASRLWGIDRPPSGFNPKIAIYSCNFGKYRNETNSGIDGGVFYDNFDYYFFTDDLSFISKKWKIIRMVIPPDDDVMNGNRWASKDVKFNLPEILRNYDYVIWIDSKLLKFTAHISYPKVVKLLYKNPNICLFNRLHPHRKTTEEEIQVTIKYKLENEIPGKNFLEIASSIKNKPKLVETEIIIRKRDKETDDLLRECFNLMKTYKLKRDQNVYSVALALKEYPAIKYLAMPKPLDIR